MLADHLVEDVPDLRLLFFDQLLGLLDRSRQALGVEARIDERLEQFERHLLRQPALMQLELGADHDHRTAGIVDPLAEQVLTEPALLALEHVGKRLQGPLVGAGDDPPASTDPCNMRFSLRMIMSGARNSISRFKRLLRLMTRR